MNAAEDLWYEAPDGRLLHALLVRPPGFDPSARYPLILLVHGGPQGAWTDEFHYRWNAQLFASRGAAVLMPNPRGSTGFGQALTDAISGDWGGPVHEETLAALDHVIARFPWLDGTRVAMAGASFGGWLVNSMLGRTDRFRAAVTHDGIFVSEAMAYTTDELWFEEVEQAGLPHTNRAPHRAHSPHLGVERFRTPTLVVHGEQDFRCPVSEGLGMFTALQVMGVPSRLLTFPDEGHWVLQPANAQVWWHEVLGWLHRWLEG
jgi:dipeptidyl aminopeptidase/acylaminoacyl peptidase